MTTINNTYISHLILIANLVLNGIVDDGYNKLSKKDKEFVDCYVRGAKIRKQLDYNNTFNNKSNDNKFYVC